MEYELSRIADNLGLIFMILLGHLIIRIWIYCKETVDNQHKIDTSHLGN